MHTYLVRDGSGGFDGLVRVERERPGPAGTQVLARMRAAALNSRDLATVLGKYGFGPLAKRDVVPLSDGAGEVVAVGPGVTHFRAGDRVVTTFFQTNPPGTLGTPLDGCLTEYAVFSQDGLLPVRAHLSFEEGATLTRIGDAEASLKLVDTAAEDVGAAAQA